ncbi:MAG: hypothetical protein JSR91_07480 [Proteobacteria bacterium]|nr:hypothetical protein [Pseudomonadota bacterium]
MPAARLSFGDVLSESFGFFFNNLALFFHLVTIPWVLSVLLRIVSNTIAADSLMVVLLEKAADLIPTVMFLVAWNRATLLSPQQVDLPGLRWSPRETALLLYLLRIAGITFVLLAAFTLTAGPIDPAALGQVPLDPEVARREAMAAPLGTGFFISALLALRVSFGLAAAAVDVSFTPRQAWAASRGNAWPIIGALFTIFFASGVVTIIAALVPMSLVRGILDGTIGATILAWTVATLVSYGGAAVIATAQAIIFRRLTGWRNGHPLVLPS